MSAATKPTPRSRRSDTPVAEVELDDDLAKLVRRTSIVRQGFYIVVLLVALAGQVSGAVETLGIPLIAAIPAVSALELGGIVVLANADVRRRLGERAVASRLLSVAIAASAVTFNWLAHKDHLLGGFFAGMSALGYLVWLMHTENQRRDRLRMKGDLPPTTPAYELVGHWLKHPWLTTRARALAKADPRLGLYDSLASARADIKRENRQSAIAKVLHRKIRAAVDPRTADIAIAVYDLDEIAARLSERADYDGLTSLIAADLAPERLAPNGVLLQRDPGRPALTGPDTMSAQPAIAYAPTVNQPASNRSGGRGAANGSLAAGGPGAAGSGGRGSGGSGGNGYAANGAQVNGAQVNGARVNGAAAIGSASNDSAINGNGTEAKGAGVYGTGINGIGGNGGGVGGTGVNGVGVNGAAANGSAANGMLVAGPNGGGADTVGRRAIPAQPAASDTPRRRKRGTPATEDIFIEPIEVASAQIAADEPSGGFGASSLFTELRRDLGHLQPSRGQGRHSTAAEEIDTDTTLRPDTTLRADTTLSAEKSLRRRVHQALDANVQPDDQRDDTELVSLVFDELGLTDLERLSAQSYVRSWLLETRTGERIRTV